MTTPCTLQRRKNIKSCAFWASTRVTLQRVEHKAMRGDTVATRPKSKKAALKAAF